MQAKSKGNAEQKIKTPKSGMPCPDCGRILNDGGITGGAWCRGCGSVFGAQHPKPNTPQGLKADAFLRNIESWLAKPHTAADIEQLLKPDNLADLYKTFGYAPLAWKRGTDILRAGLKRLQAERDQNRPVQRKGVQLFYPGGNDKRAQLAKRHGKLGGRPLEDGQTKIDEAVQDVLARLKNNPHLRMKRACELAIKEILLTITWPALQKHVKKAQRKHTKMKKTQSVTN